MKRFIYILSIGALVTGAFSCTKKDMELEVWQQGCKNFKVKDAEYSKNYDFCDNGGTEASYDITMKYTKSEECIFRIVNTPEFLDENENPVTNVPDYSSYASILKTDTDHDVSNKTISYPFIFNFANNTDATTFNHCILTIHAENEIGTQSDKVRLLLFTDCSKVTSSMYTTHSESVIIDDNETFFTLRLWDNAAEDGDLVSVYLNGEWIITEHSLLNDGQEWSVPTSLLNNGTNKLVVFAINEGSSGPNTVAISIDGKEIEDFNPGKSGLETGEAVDIIF